MKNPLLLIVASLATLFSIDVAAQTNTFPSSGDAGIGTTSPNSKLDVRGIISQNLDGQSSHSNFLINADAAYESGVVLKKAGSTKWQIYVPGSSNDLAFYDGAGTAEAVRIKSGGNVGIGTASPSYKLDVNGTARISNQLYLDNPHDGTGQLFFKSSAGDYSNWIGANGYNMRFQTRGTSQSYEFRFGSSSQFLKIYGGNGGNLQIGAENGTADFTGIGIISGQGNGQLTIINDDANSQSTKGTFFDRTSRLSAAGAGAITSWGYNGAEVARLTTAGSFGIGTTSPLAKLSSHIADGATQTNNIGILAKSNFWASSDGYSNSLPQISFGYGIGTYAPGAIGMLTTGTSGYTKGDLVFATRDVTTDAQPSERMRISSDGKVGIGITTPSAILHAKSGGITGTQGVFEGSSTVAGIRLINTTSANHYIQSAGNNLDFYVNSGSTQTMTITGGAPGNVGIGTTTPNTNFDVNGYINGGNGISVGTTSYSSNVPQNGFTLKWAGSYGGFYIGAGAGFGYKFFTNATERLKITDTKITMQNTNVLVGTDTDNGNQFQVNGNIWATGFILPTGAAAGKVLTSDANGVASWQTAAGGSSGWAFNGNTVGTLKKLGTTDSIDIPIITNNAERMRVLANGSVLIGTSAVPASDAKLAVKGYVYSTKSIVTQIGWADYVFHPSYKLPSLSEVEAFIKQNQHLPEIPSAAEVEKKGLDLGDMSKNLLKKIEELTLYMIDMKKENEELRKKVSQLEKSINKK